MNMKVMLDKGAFMPFRAHHADAGYDLKSPINITVRANSSAIVDTGVHIQLPIDFAGFLKSKSGLNVKHGITSEGVIDSEYTGSIVVKLYNHTNLDYQISVGDKITQLVILPIATPELIETDSMESTERGAAGFGSTGK